MLLAGSLPGENPHSPPLYYPSQSADEWLERNDINLRLSTSNGPQVYNGNIIIPTLSDFVPYKHNIYWYLWFLIFIIDTNSIVLLLISFICLSLSLPQGSLPLVVATFSLDGAFLGLSDVDGEIVLCGERPSRLQSAWRAGVLYQIQVHNRHWYYWSIFLWDIILS